MKVLIADDDPMWRKLLDRQVRSWGYDVVVAEDGQQAWRHLRGKDAPNVAIIDWQMPGLDGLEICRRVKKDSNLPFIYTIMLTGRDSRQDIVTGLESGADDYLAKPVDSTILRSRLTVAGRIVEAMPSHRQIPGYELIERLGAGAMSVVYKARQVSLDRLVAIKILPKKFSDKIEFVDQFYVEGRAAAKLNHPNIVSALDVGKVGENHYFVMEYVEGQTVDEIIDQGPYSETDALAVGTQIAKALHHAHEAGFIHRDVKPKNIIITREGVAKLADMGLARAVSDREAAEAEKGKMYGTPFYISPEQIRGQVDIDFGADIYCFGATLYHMVTGRVPFDGSNPTAIMEKHLRARLIPPDHINADLTSGISEIIEVCMAKDRSLRYANTAALIDDLEAVAQGEAPTHSRKVFDLSSLAALEKKEDSPKLVKMPDKPPIKITLLFWIAVSGWLLAGLLLIVLIARWSHA